MSEQETRVHHNFIKYSYTVHVEYSRVEIEIWMDPETRKIKRIEVDGKVLTGNEVIALQKVLNMVTRGEAKVGE